MARAKEVRASVRLPVILDSAADFRGQERALLLLERYIRKGRLSGTLLLEGQPGLGKTTLAFLIARALNCEARVPAATGAEAAPTPHPLWFCGACFACRTIASGEQQECTYIRPRTKVLGIEYLREEYDGLRTALLHPQSLRYRVFILDEAHLLSEAAANSLLKLFEEAPARTLFILCTDKPLDMLPTILSRSQRFRLAPLAAAVISRHLLAAGVAAADAADAAALALGSFPLARALAAEKDWRAAVRELAAAMLLGQPLTSRQSSRAAGFELAALTARMAGMEGLSLDDFAKLTPAERRNELARMAAAMAYTRAAAAAAAAPERTQPRAARSLSRLLPALADLRAMLNQNVDTPLAQAAFDAAIRGG